MAFNDSDSDDEYNAPKRNPNYLNFLDTDSDDDFRVPNRPKGIFDDSDSDYDLPKKRTPEVDYNELIQMSRGVKISPKPESPRPASTVTNTIISAAAPTQSAQREPTPTSTLTPAANKSLSQTVTNSSSKAAPPPPPPASRDEAAKKIDSIVTLNPLLNTSNSQSQPNIDTFQNRASYPAFKNSSNNNDSKPKYSSAPVSDPDKLSLKKNYKETIDRIILHEPYSLDVYKTKTEKEALLNEAIKSYDGNAILAVMMHLKRTLARHVFFEIAQRYPVALNQHKLHLQQMNAKEDLLDMYKWQNRHVEAATLSHFKPILLGNQDIKAKENLMDDFVNKYGGEAYQSIASSQVYVVVKKYMALLKIQSELLKNRATFLRKEKQKQDAMDNLYPSSLNYTVSFWLKYSRDLYHSEYHTEENFKKQFELQNKQYSIWFVTAMAEAGYWTELDKFLNQKNFFNIVKNSVLSYETIFKLIANAKGPNDQLSKYLSLVEDVETKKNLAVKFKLVDVAIEAFKAQKDRVGLLNFRENFDGNSIQYLKISKEAADPKNKWKN